MSVDTCPLCCNRSIHPKRVLYGVPTCKKCYYAFANRRQIAYLVDAVLWNLAIFVPLGFIIGFVVASNPSITQQTEDQLFLLLDVLPYPLFLLFIMKDGFGGKSLGKSICGVMVVDQDTYHPISFASSFKRNLILIVPILPLVIAFLLQKGHRLGDGWANSKVIWTKYRNHPLFTGQLACPGCQYDLRGCTSTACPECGHPIAEYTQQAIQDAGPPDLSGSTTPYR